MRYYNLKDRKITTGFRDAVLQGISSGSGLFMPEEIPPMGPGFFRRLPDMSLREIAVEVAMRYAGDDIPLHRMEKICDEAYDFPVIVRPIDDRKQVVELFHGPTAAFKDFGARFMAGCFDYFSSQEDRKTVVIVATSGDTGGAVASGFLGVEGVDVIILYPSGKVSLLQEKQLTTLGMNITALEIEGTFDDCQAMAKNALATLDTGGRIRLTSANSINIARLVPQTFYYFYAVARTGGKCAVSVPSGNFGNITAAAMAWKSGLEIEQLVAATNINRVVPEYLATGIYRPAASIQTIASAMDVGNPGNFERLKRIFDDDHSKISKAVSGFWCNDTRIRQHIKDEYIRTGYILDPHGAVASMGLDHYLGEHPQSSGIFIETAHPAKFTDVVEPLIGKPIEIPENLDGSLSGTRHYVVMKPEYKYLEEYLTERYGLK